MSRAELEEGRQPLILSLDHVVDTGRWQAEIVPLLRRCGPALLAVAERGRTQLQQQHGQLTQMQTAGAAADPSHAVAVDVEDDVLGNVEVSYETEMCISETGVSELCISGAVIKAFESHNQVSPTTRGLYLSRPSCRAAMDHQKRGDASLWRESALYHSGALRPLKDFVDQCLAGKVLSEVGRVWLILDSSGQPGLRHRDHNIADFSNEFVWLRDPYKAFQVFADDGSYAQSPTGIAAWFDARWQHQAGAPLLPPEMADDHVAGQSPPLSISLRVDGRFTPELRAWKHQAERWRTAD